MSNKKSRVLQICGVEFGGIESLVFNLITRMKNREISFEYFSPMPKGKSFESEISKSNIPIHYIPKKNKILQVIDLYRLLKSRKYTVVHSHNLFSSGANLFIAFLAGVPIRIAHAHNTRTSRKSTFFRKVYENCMRVFIRIFSTDMIAVSEESAAYVFGKNSLKNKKTKIIRNGIDIEKFNPKNYDSENVKTELGLNTKDIHFVSVARFSIQKNQAFLVEIFEEILKLMPNAHLTFVGGGELEVEVKELVSNKGLEEKVTFLGYRSDVARVLSAMDYFILPSLWEGFGIVYIEAQAMGLYCFASDCIPKAADAGYIDFISLESSPSDWANKIYAVHQRTKDIHPKIGSEFDIKVIESQLAKIYER